MARKTKRKRDGAPAAATPGKAALLRIVGGQFRGRQIQYDGDRRTRPMKDRVREAVFNLIGPAVKEKHVLDLFAGTGAMGLEALSRGAASVTAIERSFPAVRMIRNNAALLGVESKLQAVRADVFHWWAARRELATSETWLAFCCPPYALYVDQRREMLALAAGLMDRTPRGSLVVLEFDERLAASDLPDADRWDVRRYSPAMIAIFEKR